LKAQPLLITLAVPLVLLGALVVVLLLVVIPGQQAQIIENAVKEELHDIGGALAVSVEFALEKEELGLLSALNGYLSDNPTLAMTGVFMGPPGAEELLAEFPQGVGLSEQLSVNADQFISREIPISTDLFDGYVVVASSREYLNERVASLQWPLYAAIVISTSLGLVVMGLLLRSVIYPLSAASRLAAALGRGELDEKVPVEATVEEIGTLLRALNRLSEGLRDQRAHNQHLLHTLEDKVEERTRELEAALVDKTAQERQIWEMAHFDDLTGLFNRNLFTQKFDEVLQAGQPFSIIVTDINDFKLINDTQGHIAGDAALRGYASAIREAITGDVIIGRLGGDEFAVILRPVLSETDAERVYQTLESRARAIEYSDTRQPGLSISFGAARFPEDGQTRFELMRAADTAMYNAKQHKLSGSAFAVFHAGMDTYRLQLVQLRERIKQALLEDEFEMAYQPIWDIRTGALISCEGLLRWPSNDYTRIDQVIAAAEETGLILEIGEFVVDHTLALAARTRSIAPSLTHSINVSPIQFRNQDLPAMLEEKLAEYQESGQRVILEITESTFIDNIQRTQLMLARLNEMGVSVAIDDFGTGYSNLSVLHQFTVDWIKIDRSLVAGVEEGSNNYQIVNAIVQMAENINMRVVAEGVETLNELEVLRSIGCDRIQGYLLSRPVSADQLLQMLLQEQEKHEPASTSAPFVQRINS